MVVVANHILPPVLFQRALKMVPVFALQSSLTHPGFEKCALNEMTKIVPNSVPQHVVPFSRSPARFQRISLCSEENAVWTRYEES